LSGFTTWYILPNSILLFAKSFKNPSFLKNKKALQPKAKGLEMSWLPLLDTFRTFKGNIATENIRLNQIILQY